MQKVTNCFTGRSVVWVGIHAMMSQNFERKLVLAICVRRWGFVPCLATWHVTTTDTPLAGPNY
jgi:hypothetical protein